MGVLLQNKDACHAYYFENQVFYDKNVHFEGGLLLLVKQSEKIIKQKVL